MNTRGRMACVSLFSPSPIRWGQIIFLFLVTFIKLDLQSLRAYTVLLRDFGTASGLHTNLVKNFAHPIRCSEEQVLQIVIEMECQVLGWPYKYLGLPLGLWKISAVQLQYMIDKMADRLPASQARLLFRAGRLELLRTTLASMPIHAMKAIDMSVKTIGTANKICRGFMWKGRRNVQGGHCVVAWDQVCTPKAIGGLGVPNLRLLNAALRAKWPWLERTDPNRPWKEFNLQVSCKSLGIYRAATRYVLGDGESARFWTDWWMSDGRIEEIMPNVFAFVRKPARLKTVRHAMVEGWWHDISPDMTTRALLEFIALVDTLQEVELSRGSQDRIHSA
ncbi:hypothetical protein D1007_03520 [Hordeum vulgare]|nr:hypothetical protein D1007_03520 [Hordeum vulgare]